MRKTSARLFALTILVAAAVCGCDDNPSAPRVGVVTIDPGDTTRALAAEGALRFTRTYTSQHALIPAGTFVMGSPVSEPGRFDNETQHQVTLTRDFELKPTKVTHRTWLRHEGFPYTARGYRLPTEAEWEYACRAGSTEAFANGPVTYAANDCNRVDANLEPMGWSCANSRNGAHTVALNQPNAWGLYDLHGGVMEWCNDR